MKNKSFTLIELLVVIVIIGILAGVIIVSVNSSINKANFAKAQAFSSTVQNELLGDLVSEWTFDNASNPGEDTWGNNDGNVHGATYKSKADGVCVYGGCYEFDGGDYIEVLDNNSLDFTVNLTISLWLQTTNSLETLGVISKQNNETGSGSPKYIIDIGGTGQVRFFGYVGTNPVGITTRLGSSYNNGEWHHITGTFNGADWGIYGDGALIQTYIESCTLENSIYPIYIGARNNNAGYFNGLIDDVRIYNATLSTSQIKQQYVAGLDSLLSNGNISKEEYDERLNDLALGGS